MVTIHSQKSIFKILAILILIYRHIYMWLSVFKWLFNINLNTFEFSLTSLLKSFIRHKSQFA